MSGKKKQQFYINCLIAIRDKDIRKIQLCENSIEYQYRQLVCDIKDTIKHCIENQKENNRLKDQLASTNAKNKEFFVQIENLKHVNCIKYQKNQKILQQCFRVYEYFRTNRLQEAKSIAFDNSDIKRMLLNLGQYQQLKLQFCKKNQKAKYYTAPSKQYIQLKKKLSQKKAQVNEVHKSYENILQALLISNQLDLASLSYFPEKTSNLLQALTCKIASLKERVMSFAQKLQDHPQKNQEWQEQWYHRSNIKIQNMPFGFQNSQQYCLQHQPVKGEQSLLRDIREKLEAIQQILNRNFLTMYKSMKMANHRQQRQVQVLQKVISVLKSKQISQIKSTSNSQIKRTLSNQEKQAYEEQIAMTQSIKERNQQLEKQIKQFSRYLKKQIQTIIDSKIENPLVLDNFYPQQINQELLQNVFSNNLGQLIREYKQLSDFKARTIEKQQFIQHNTYYSENYAKVNKNENNSRIFQGSDFQSVQQMAELMDQIKELQKQLKSYQSSLQQKQALIIQLQKQISASKNQNSRLQHQKSSLRQQLGKTVGRIKTIQNELGKSLIKCSMLRPEISEDNNSQVARLQQQLQNMKKDVGSRQVLILQKDKQLNQLTNKLSSAEAKLKDTQEKLNKFINSDKLLKQKKEQLMSEIQKLKEQKLSLKEENKFLISQVERLNQSYREALASPKQVQFCNICQQKHKLQGSAEEFNLQKRKSQNYNHLNNPNEQVTNKEYENLKNQLNEQKDQLKKQTLKAQQYQETINIIKGQKQLLNKKIMQKDAKIQQLMSSKKKVQQSKSQLLQRYHSLNQQLEIVKRQVISLQSQLVKKTLEIDNLKQKLKIKQNQEETRQIVQRNDRFEDQASRYEVRKMNQHLFTAGDIFDQYYEQQRLELVKQLESHLRPIKRTKLIYKYDTINRVNFHKYIDDHKHIVLVIKTLYGKVIAAYSEECFNSNGTKKGNAYLMALWNKKIYQVFKDKKGITYDDYFLIFGNSEIRIRSLQSKFFSNFGVGNSYFNNLGDKIEQFAGQKDRQIDMLSYQLYELQFE